MARPTRSWTRSRRMTMLATDRVHVLREAIMSCRKGGTISIPGVYVGMGDKIPLGAAMNKGLTHQDGPDPRAGLHQTAAGEDRGRRDRSRASSSPTLPVSRTRRRCTRSFGTRKTASSRSCCGRASRPSRRYTKSYLASNRRSRRGQRCAARAR